MSVPDLRSSLGDEAARVLAANDTGTYIRPGPRQYPGQWNWDAAFNVIGLAHLDPDRARREVRSLLEGQWSDGMIPHIVFHDPGVAYFPGPEVWGRVDQMPSVATSGITQPPLLATAVARLHHIAPNRPFLGEVLDPLDRWHAWLFAHRRTARGLVGILHPWESGMDNSPRFDHALSGVRPTPIEFERRDLIHVPPDQRPTDSDYDAYVSILYRMREHAYRPPPGSRSFEIADPFLTAILLRAEADLAAMLDQIGFDSTQSRRRASQLRRALVSHLDSDGRTGRPPHGAPTSFGELLAVYGCPDHPALGTLAAALRDPTTFGSSPDSRWYPTSVSKSDPAYDPRRYWRGPVWVNVNWLTFQALVAGGFAEEARRLRSSTLEMVATQGFWEYYEPKTGQGLGSDRFSWTAALTIDLLALPADKIAHT